MLKLGLNLNKLDIVRFLREDTNLSNLNHPKSFDDADDEQIGSGFDNTIDIVNYACSKILEAKFRLGLFENRFVDEDDIPEKIFSQYHTKTALKLARQGIVLLKNNDEITNIRI
mgnify:CR=1 FL=1